MTANILQMNDTTQYWAKRYCERGWRLIAVHGLVDAACTCKKGKECPAKGKHPIKGNWPKEATNDYDKILPQLEGSKNIGIACGDGLVVFDVDGDIGRESLKQLIRDHGNLPDGPTVETGSGGIHFFFKTTETFRNRTGILPGLDLRTEGGQVVAVPSKHRSGRTYAWVGDSFELDLPELPEWLAGIFRGSDKIEWDAEGWLREQNPAISGEGGNKVFMSVIGTLVRNGVRDLDKFLKVIRNWNGRCQPPWSEEELTRGFNNAINRFREQPTIELRKDKNGKVICNRADLHRIIMQDLNYEFAFKQDARTHKIYFNGVPIEDEDFTIIEVDICERYGVARPERPDLIRSISVSAAKRKFNPITDYLDSLHWDGQERLAALADNVLNIVEPKPIYAVFLKRWFIGAVARAYEPGCKVDTMLILQGGQGLYKSGFFKTLTKPWYNEGAITLGDKDSLMKLHEVWCHEWAELDNFAKYESEKIKCFLSSSMDKLRLPYGRVVKDLPRSFVMVGTTNSEKFLQDRTGNRRFQVIPVGDEIDLKKLDGLRDQLWAEAVTLYKNGEQHWLTSAETAQQREAAGLFETADEIYNMVRNHVEYGADRTTWANVCALIGISNECRGITRESISRALRDSGFESCVYRQDGKVIRGWVREPKVGVD